MYYPSRAISLFVFALLCSGIMLVDGTHADEPSIEIEFAKKPELAERELEFQASEEPLEVELFAANPKLLEQKYVAVLQLKWPVTDRRSYLTRYASSSRPSAMDLLKRSYWATLQDPRSNPRSRSFAGAEISEVIKGLAEKATEEWKRRPGAAALLDANRLGVATESRNSPRGFSPNSTAPLEISQTVHLLAPDADAAREMTLAFLALYDETLSKPIQQDYISKMESSVGELPEMKKRYLDEHGKIEGMEKEVAKYEFVTQETIADLKTQKRLISVDMSGAKARVEACEKLLQNPVMSIKSREQVESIKITAEIELVGMTARKESISQIIDDGNERFRLSSRLSSQKAKTGQIRRSIESVLGKVSDLEKERKSFRPLQVRDNTVVVRPIDWQSGRSESTFGR